MNKMSTLNLVSILLTGQLLLTTVTQVSSLLGRERQHLCKEVFIEHYNAIQEALRRVAAARQRRSSTIDMEYIKDRCCHDGCTELELWRYLQYGRI